MADRWVPKFGTHFFFPKVNNGSGNTEFALSFERRKTLVATIHWENPTKNLNVTLAIKNVVHGYHGQQKID